MENRNYCSILGGVILGLYWGNIWIMEKKMEASIAYIYKPYANGYRLLPSYSVIDV